MQKALTEYESYEEIEYIISQCKKQYGRQNSHASINPFKGLSDTIEHLQQTPVKSSMKSIRPQYEIRIRHLLDKLRKFRYGNRSPVFFSPFFFPFHETRSDRNKRL